MLMGTPEQKERWLAPFKDRSQPRWSAFGMTEPGAGSDVARISTRIREDGEIRYLTEEERDIQRRKASDTIAVHCN